MNRRSLLSICLLLGWLGEGPVLAQTPASASTGTDVGAASSDTTEIPEITVTAEKRSERESDVPMSITAASGDQLAKLGITSPADLSQIVPGFTYTQGAKGSPIYTLRGVGFFTEAIGVAPAVSIYSDQVPLPFSRMAEGTALDLERVEVLKGPQGILFGQNSTGGAINYIAAKPTSDFESGADATYGRFNEVDLGGFVSGPLSNTVNARLAVRTENRDGWQENYVSTGDTTGTSQNINGVRAFYTARALIDWQASDSMKWEFNLNGWKDQSDAQAWQKIAYYALQPGGYAGSPGYPNLQAQLMAYPNAPHDDTAAGFDLGTSLRRNDGFYQFSARGDLDVAPKVTLTSITAYSHLYVYDPNDNDGTDLPDQFVPVLGGVTSYSEELRLAGTTLRDDKLKWLVGGNYEYDSTRDLENIYINGTNSGFGDTRFQTLRDFSNQIIHTAALFGNVDYEIVEGLTGEAGVRYTNRMDEFHGCLADSGLPNGIGPGFAALSSELSGSPTTVAPGACLTLGPNNKPLPIVTNSLNEDNVSYRAGLSWKIIPSLLAYANITKGYKAGVFETLPAVTAAQLAPDKQESVQAYELGMKSFLFDRRLEVNGAVFYYDYRDKQIDGDIETQYFGNLTALVSIPRSRVEGAEIDTTWAPVRGLTVNLAGTYISSKIQSDFVTGAALTGTVNIEGQAFPNTPKWQLTSDAEYDFPITRTFNGFVGGGASYQSTSIAAFGGGPLFNIDDYALLNLRAGLASSTGRWRLQVWGRNVTDKYYWTSVEHQEDTVDRLAGMPATYGVTMSARF